jgi:tRNA(fMet)-specific endonuclease VapC
MLDGSVLIAAERGHFSLPERLARRGEEPVALSAVTASELLHGVHRARTAAQRARRRAFVEGVLAAFPVAELGLPEARVHAELWARLRGDGQVIGAHDLLVAATAVALGFRIATCNARDFARVPTLTVEDWLAP